MPYEQRGGSTTRRKIRNITACFWHTSQHPAVDQPALKPTRGNQGLRPQGRKRATLARAPDAVTRHPLRALYPGQHRTHRGATGSSLPDYRCAHSACAEADGAGRHAPSSTKNEEGKCDPEIHQSKKGKAAAKTEWSGRRRCYHRRSPQIRTGAINASGSSNHHICGQLPSGGTTTFPVEVLMDSHFPAFRVQFTEPD